MNTDENVLIISGKHGSNKFDIKLECSSTVKDLMDHIENVTEVPMHYQRIICKGRVLNSTDSDLQKELRLMGLQSPVKIQVFGKKPDEDDENYKVIKTWESKYNSAANQLLKIKKDIDDIEKGYSPQQLIIESLPKMEKKICVIAEDLMKMLESLDALTFGEIQKEARAKRKSLIDKIHALHEQCDKLAGTVQQLRSKV